MQIGNVPPAHTAAINVPQAAAARPSTAATPVERKDKDGDHDGSTTTPADGSSGRQINVVA